MTSKRRCAGLKPYSIFVLILLLLVFTSNQTDRYILAVVVVPMQEAVGFGDVEYSILAGPCFTIPFCMAVLPVGFLADRYNKVRLLTFMIFLWTTPLVLMAFATKYWQLVLLRIVYSFSQCASICTGLISEYFPLRIRGTAIGIFNMGIYFGVANSYGIGNYLTDEIGYRKTLFYMSGPAGVLLSILLVSTVRAKKQITKANSEEFAPAKIDENTPLIQQKVASSETFPKYRNSTFSEGLGSTLEALPPLSLPTTTFITPNASNDTEPTATSRGLVGVGIYFWKHKTLRYLTIASFFRMTSTVIPIYYMNIFYQTQHNMSQTEIAAYLSWIPVLGGLLGAIFGGFLSDWFAHRSGGGSGRVFVMFLTCLIDTPFEFGTLYLPVQYSFFCFAFSSTFQAAYPAGAFAVVLHIVRSNIRVSCISIFLLCTFMTGANSPLLQPIIEDLFSSFPNKFQISLAILFPGMTAMASILYLYTFFVQRKYERRKRERKHTIVFDKKIQTSVGGI